MEHFPVMAKCYDRWLELQGQVQSYYSGKATLRLPLSQQKELREVKNAVIQEAECVRCGEITFEDADMQRQDDSEDDRRASNNYWHLRNTCRCPKWQPLCGVSSGQGIS